MSLTDLRELCDFLLIPFNATTIKSYDLRALLHEIANDGARKSFESKQLFRQNFCWNFIEFIKLLDRFVICIAFHDEK